MRQADNDIRRTTVVSSSASNLGIGSAVRGGVAAIRSPWGIVAAITVAGMLALAGSIEPAVSAVATTNGDVYQIVKTSGDRIWRLDKRTGEIAVCTLDGDNLLCTTSAEAITPPAKTFDERQAEKAQAKAEAAQRRDEERARDLAFLERAMSAIKTLIQAAMERDAAGGQIAE